MSSSSWLLGVESHDFSLPEKERTACKAEKIHKTIFTQNGPNNQKLCRGNLEHLNLVIDMDPNWLSLEFKSSEV